MWSSICLTWASGGTQCRSCVWCQFLRYPIIFELRIKHHPAIAVAGEDEGGQCGKTPSCLDIINYLSDSPQYEWLNAKCGSLQYRGPSGCLFRSSSPSTAITPTCRSSPKNQPFSAVYQRGTRRKIEESFWNLWTGVSRTTWCSTQVRPRGFWWISIKLIRSYVHTFIRTIKWTDPEIPQRFTRRATVASTCCGDWGLLRSAGPFSRPFMTLWWPLQCTTPLCARGVESGSYSHTGSGGHP